MAEGWAQGMCENICWIMEFTIDAVFEGISSKNTFGL